jgi:hypothetical protein
VAVGAVKRASIVAVALIAAVCSDHIAAQSLGELGRREDARRKQAGRGKVLTDADLPSQPKPASAVPIPATAPPKPAAVPAGTPAGSASGQPTTEAKPPELVDVKDPRDETYWRAGARDLNQRMQRIRTDIAVVEQRLAQLEGGSGAAREYDVTKDALAKLRQDLQFFSDERQRFEQKAQLSKVPLEWLQ